MHYTLESFMCATPSQYSIGFLSNDHLNYDHDRDEGDKGEEGFE